ASGWTSAPMWASGRALRRSGRFMVMVPSPAWVETTTCSYRMAPTSRLYSTVAALLHCVHGSDPRGDPAGARRRPPRNRPARRRSDRPRLDRPASGRRDPRDGRRRRRGGRDGRCRLPRDHALAATGRAVRPPARRDGARHHARARAPAGRRCRVARGAQPVRTPRSHDPRDGGLRRAWCRQPPGARDVERGEAPAHDPSGCARVPDRAPALRGERRVRRPLRTPGSAVSGLPGFWELLGFTIERADESEAVLRMDVPETLLSPFGTVHGGVIATLFDTGLAVAIARRLDPEDRIATHNLNVTYVAFTRDRVLRCRARVVSL